MSFNNFNNNCGTCGKPKKLVPAGVSKKTGKPYKAFYVCPDKCDSTNWTGKSLKTPNNANLEALIGDVQASLFDLHGKVDELLNKKIDTK